MIITSLQSSIDRLVFDFFRFAIGGYGEKGHLSVAHDRQAGQKRDASKRLLT